MRNWIALMILVFLLACQPALNTVPTDDVKGAEAQAQLVQETNLCKDVTCRENQICKDGKCDCSGLKCKGICLPENSCCEDTDCPQGKCENNKCVVPDCNFNQENKDGACECKEGFEFCKEQNKCIEQGDCCRHTDCPRGDRCVDTGFKTNFCIQTEDKKICRLLADNGRDELISIGDFDLRVNAGKWLADGSVLFILNGENATLMPGVEQDFKGFKIYQEGIEVIGGFCKEDNQD